MRSSYPDNGNSYIGETIYIEMVQEPHLLTQINLNPNMDK